jgi:hypothetical protein
MIISKMISIALYKRPSSLVSDQQPEVEDLSSNLESSEEKFWWSFLPSR